MAREGDRAKMELRATMELRVGRDKSTGKKRTPYIVWDKDPTVIHLPARGQRYYRRATRYYRLLPSGTTARSCGTTVQARGTAATPAIARSDQKHRI